jgi:hypothetical protein
LVIRAWLEDGLPAPALRARIIETSEGGSLETVAAGEDEVVAVVRDWLGRFAAGDVVVTRPP